VILTGKIKLPISWTPFDYTVSLGLGFWILWCILYAVDSCSHAFDFSFVVTVVIMLRCFTQFTQLWLCWGVLLNLHVDLWICFTQFVLQIDYQSSLL